MLYVAIVYFLCCVLFHYVNKLQFHWVYFWETLRGLFVLFFETGSYTYGVSEDSLCNWRWLWTSDAPCRDPWHARTTAMGCDPHFMQCWQSNSGFLRAGQALYWVTLLPILLDICMCLFIYFLLCVFVCVYSKQCWCKPHPSLYVSKYADLQRTLLMIDLHENLDQRSRWILSRDNLDRITVSKVWLSDVHLDLTEDESAFPGILKLLNIFFLSVGHLGFSFVAVCWKADLIYRTGCLSRSAFDSSMGCCLLLLLLLYVKAHCFLASVMTLWMCSGVK